MMQSVRGLNGFSVMRVSPGISAAVVCACLSLRLTAAQTVGSDNFVSIQSVSTGECLDTTVVIDLYDCVADGHNERFTVDAANASVRVGPGDNGPGGGPYLADACLRALSDGTVSQAACNASAPDQRFVLATADGNTNGTGTIAQGKLCLTAGPKADDTWVRLLPCVANSTAQQFRTVPSPFPPPPPTPAPTPRYLRIDPAAPGSKRFDGHGGLSAGASSRLLFDYPEPQRSDILDYLYRPAFGAGLTMCKIEIGGDGQSTDGAEASHMHTRGDLNFERGYEFWLAKEAKKRNPKVTIYGLSWAAPGWINNGTDWNVTATRPSCPQSPGAAPCAYFSDDMIRYQVNFVAGAARHNLTVDYLGIWNERPWGTAAYVKSLRAALDRAGFTSTAIVGADGAVPQDEVAALQQDSAFSSAVPILGLHYPCERTVPEQVWSLPGPPKVVWSSEDNSGISGNWKGGSAWGRSLLQNFVKVNATSTISWSTIWAAYEPWMYLGSGIGPSAWEPWSGNYSVYSTVWTSAHVCQFSEPGWRFLGGQGTGLLHKGGSWTAMAPPASRTCAPPSLAAGAARRTVPQACGDRDLTIVLEKLEAAALRCRVPPTQPETVRFNLTSVAQGGLTSMALWLSNASHQFVRLQDVPVRGGILTVDVPRDTMLTLTTTTGQRKGVARSSMTAKFKPFPFPYRTNFDDDTVHKPARFMADNDGSFEVLPAVDGSGNNLAQTTPLYPMLGYGDVDPITSLGAPDWSNYGVSVRMQIVAPRPSYAVGDDFIVDPDHDTGLLRRNAPSFPLPGWTGDAKCPNCTVAAGAYAGVCVRLLVRFSGVCLLAGAGLSPHVPGTAGYRRGWVVAEAGPGNCRKMQWNTLAAGALDASWDLKAWHNMSLSVLGNTLNGSVDGRALFRDLRAGTPGAVHPAGLASIRSGFHYARFDDFAIFEVASPSPWPAVLFDKHLLSTPAAYPGGATTPPKPRNDFDGAVGCAFTLARAVQVTALGRFSSGWNSCSSASAPSGPPCHAHAHTLELVDSATRLQLAAVNLSASSNLADTNGYVWARLPTPVALAAGTRLFLLSSERSSADSFYEGVMVQSAVLRGFATPVWRESDKNGTQTYHDLDTFDNDAGFSSGKCYGPINLEFA